MREIKFRAWEKSSKILFYDVKDISPHEDYYLMQYTGLKDKNGKEIYEGDLISTGKKGVLFEVHWGSKGGWAVASPNKWAPEKSSHVYKSLVWATAGEVIGNIYENPDLIKKDK